MWTHREIDLHVSLIIPRGFLIFFFPQVYEKSKQVLNYFDNLFGMLLPFLCQNIPLILP